MVHWFTQVCFVFILFVCLFFNIRFIDVYSLYYNGFSQYVMLLRMYRFNIGSHSVMNDPKISFFNAIFYLSQRDYQDGAIISPQMVIYSFCFHSLQIKNIHEFVFSEYRISLTALIPLLIHKEISPRPQRSLCITSDLDFMDFFLLADLCAYN